MDPVQTHQTDSGAVQTVSRRDPPIRENLVDVVVDCLRGGQTFDNWQIPKGKHKIRIPKSRVAALESMVLDQDAWKAAEKAFDNEIRRSIEEARHNKDVRSEKELDRYFRDTIQSSPEAWYTEMNPGAIGIFASVKVLDGEHAPPENEEQAETISLTAEAIGKALEPLVAQFLKSQQGRKS